MKINGEINRNKSKINKKYTLKNKKNILLKTKKRKGNFMPETTIDMIHGEKTAIWYSSYPSVIKQMKEYVKAYPDEVKVRFDYTSEEHQRETGEMAYEIEVPRDWVRVPRPKTKKNLTEEQRAQAGERLKRARANKKE